MKETSVVAGSLARTRALGRALGTLLQPGDFIGLEGELGAGKTELVRAVCEGAGIDLAQVSSPSFAIVAAYTGGRLPVCHADLYRIGDYDELFATGFFDLVGGAGALLVEWIDRIPEAAPEEHLWIRIEVAGPRRRRIRARARGIRHEALLRAWLG